VAPDRDAADVVLAGAPGGEPVATAPGDAPVRCAWVPEDIIELRRRDAPLARTWRLALRDAIAAAGADGFTATAMTRDGWYVLERRA
jgi:predicted GNAT superfamily acetyltransferase